MALDPTRFHAHMDAFATNSMLETFYDSFLLPQNIKVTYVHAY